ncbi:TPA: hypothetical protein ACGOXO_000464, partial [Streptococcus suis]
PFFDAKGFCFISNPPRVTHLIPPLLPSFTSSFSTSQSAVSQTTEPTSQLTNKSLLFLLFYSVISLTFITLNCG